LAGLRDPCFLLCQARTTICWGYLSQMETRFRLIFFWVSGSSAGERYRITVPKSEWPVYCMTVRGSIPALSRFVVFVARNLCKYQRSHSSRSNG
jgi:hypothetical protein